MKENNNHEQLQYIGRYINKHFVNGTIIYNVIVNRFSVGFGCFNAKCMQNTLTINNVRDGL